MIEYGGGKIQGAFRELLITDEPAAVERFVFGFKKEAIFFETPGIPVKYVRAVFDPKRKRFYFFDGKYITHEDVCAFLGLDWGEVELQAFIYEVGKMNEEFLAYIKKWIEKCKANKNPPENNMENRYNVWALDVAGDSRTGFRVKDRKELSGIRLPETFTNGQIVSALITGKILTTAAFSQVTVAPISNKTDIYIAEAKTGKPILEIERETYDNPPLDPILVQAKKQAVAANNGDLYHTILREHEIITYQLKDGKWSTIVQELYGFQRQIIERRVSAKSAAGNIHLNLVTEWSKKQPKVQNNPRKKEAVIVYKDSNRQGPFYTVYIGNTCKGHYLTTSEVKKFFPSWDGKLLGGIRDNPPSDPILTNAKKQAWATNNGDLYESLLGSYCVKTYQQKNGSYKSEVFKNYGDQEEVQTIETSTKINAGKIHIGLVKAWDKDRPLKQEDVKYLFTSWDGETTGLKYKNPFSSKKARRLEAMAREHVSDAAGHKSPELRSFDLGTAYGIKEALANPHYGRKKHSTPKHPLGLSKGQWKRSLARSAKFKTGPNKEWSSYEIAMGHDNPIQPHSCGLCVYGKFVRGSRFPVYDCAKYAFVAAKYGKGALKMYTDNYGLTNRCSFFEVSAPYRQNPEQSSRPNTSLFNRVFLLLTKMSYDHTAAYQLQLLKSMNPRKLSVADEETLKDMLAQWTGRANPLRGGSRYLFLKKGTLVHVSQRNSGGHGKGLSHPKFDGHLLEDARSGGWDVYDVQALDGKIYSVYGFSLFTGRDNPPEFPSYESWLKGRSKTDTPLNRRLYLTDKKRMAPYFAGPVRPAFAYNPHGGRKHYGGLKRSKIRDYKDVGYIVGGSMLRETPSLTYEQLVSEGRKYFKMNVAPIPADRVWNDFLEGLYNAYNHAMKNPVRAGRGASGRNKELLNSFRRNPSSDSPPTATTTFYDRNMRPFENGDTIEVKHCIGPYGQCAVYRAVIIDVHCKESALYSRLQLITRQAGSVRVAGGGHKDGSIITDQIVSWDYKKCKWIGYNHHVDFDHDHETYAVIISKGTLKNPVQLRPVTIGPKMKSAEYYDAAKARAEGLDNPTMPWKHDFKGPPVKLVGVQSGAFIGQPKGVKVTEKADGTTVISGKAKKRAWEMR